MLNLKALWVFSKALVKDLLGMLDKSPLSSTRLKFCRAVTKPVVGVFDLASNVSEGSILFEHLMYIMTN